MAMKLTDLAKQTEEKKYNLNLPSQDTGLEDIRNTLAQPQAIPQVEGPIVPEVAPTTPSLEDYKTLLEKAKQGQTGTNLIANLGQVGTEYTSRMAGYRPDVSLYEGMRKQAGMDVGAAESDVTRAEENAAKLERAKELANRTVTIKQEEMKQRAEEKEKDRVAQMERTKYQSAEAASRAKEANELKMMLAGMMQKNKLRPSETLSKSLSDATTLIDDLSEVQEIASRVDTGKLAGPVQTGLSWMGLSSKDFNTLKQKTGANLVNYIKSISGTAVSAEEAAMLEQLVPTVNMDEKVFKDTLNAFQSRLKKAMKNQLDVEEARGTDVEGLRAITSSKTQLPPQTKMIRGVEHVKVPGGWIPKE